MDHPPPPFDATWFRIVIGLIIGLCLGSFTTMLSYRMPRNLSIISPPSQCPNCHTPLKPRDLIPLFSWLTEHGKCRHCGNPISPRYLLIELSTALFCIIAFAVLGFSPAVIVALFAIIAFVTFVTINIERNKDL